MFITEAFANTTDVVANVDFMRQLGMFGIILVVFYFFLIRPQNKKFKQHQMMIDSTKKGDKAITQGGIIGKVIKVEDKEVILEIADSVRVRVLRDKLSFVGSFERADKLMVAKASTANENSEKSNHKSNKLKDILS